MNLELQKNENSEIIALLKENNQYLRQLFELQQKVHREAVMGKVIHIIVTTIPWIVVLILGYFIWESVTHYLDALNNNINTLKGNFDALTAFIEKITPDFGTIVPKLKDTWENIQFWN